MTFKSISEAVNTRFTGCLSEAVNTRFTGCLSEAVNTRFTGCLSEGVTTRFAVYLNTKPKGHHQGLTGHLYTGEACLSWKEFHPSYFLSVPSIL